MLRFNAFSWITKERDKMFANEKKKQKQRKMLTFLEFRLSYFSDRSSDVANCDQTIVFKFKIDSLSAKTESGYLQRK